MLRTVRQARCLRGTRMLCGVLDVRDELIRELQEKSAASTCCSLALIERNPVPGNVSAFQHSARQGQPALTSSRSISATSGTVSNVCDLWLHVEHERVTQSACVTGLASEEECRRAVDAAKHAMRR